VPQRLLNGVLGLPNGSSKSLDRHDHAAGGLLNGS
jgi:hypothetical protein